MQFHKLATFDPTLHWNKHHTNLWLPFMTSAKPAHWPCKHCGTTNHYPDPFCPYHIPTNANGQRIITTGRLTSGSYAPHPNQHKPITCRDFNHHACNRSDCKFAHCSEHYGDNHPGKDCQLHLAFCSLLNHNRGFPYDRLYLNVN